MLTKDPYDILGVNPTATDDEVKRAYRELAKKYHPDRYVDNPLSELAQDKFREVQEAYDTVMQERASGIPHNYNNGTYNNNYNNGYNQQSGSYYDPFSSQSQNQYRNYEQQSQRYGGTSGGNDPCECCMQLWCLDSLCECFGGDLIRCC